MSKIVTPASTIIEKTAIELAGCFYEIGRGQGLTSKSKNAREYARKNFEKFIPKATEYLLTMLHENSGASVEMKEMIYTALMERNNDPTINQVFPNIDVVKVIEQMEIAERKKQIVIDTKPPEKKTVLHND